MISRKHKNVCTTLNYIEHFPILAFAITECISSSAFASLLDTLIGITSSAIGLKICAIVQILKDQKASGLLSTLGIKTPLSKIPLLGPLLF